MFLHFCFYVFLYFSFHHPSPPSLFCLFVSRGGWHAASVNEAEVDGSGNGELHFPFHNQEMIMLRCFIKAYLLLLYSLLLPLSAKRGESNRCQ